MPNRHLNPSQLKSQWDWQKASSTLRTSQAVPHPSTDRALRCLTSEFGWDRVCSSQYGRWQKCTLHHRQGAVIQLNVGLSCSNIRKKWKFETKRIFRAPFCKAGQLFGCKYIPIKGLSSKKFCRVGIKCWEVCGFWIQIVKSGVCWLCCYLLAFWAECTGKCR